MSEAVLHPDGRLVMGGREWRAALGRAGVRLNKQEGDEATPAGLLPLRRILFRADRVPSPRAAVPREPIAADDAWCDDQYDRAYNTQIRRPISARH